MSDQVSDRDWGKELQATDGYGYSRTPEGVSRDELAKEIERAVDSFWGYHWSAPGAAKAAANQLLESSWLRRRDAATRAEALNEAADAGPWPKSPTWLRARARAAALVDPEAQR